MFEIPTEWRDSRGPYLKPRKEWTDSGNPLYYTVFFMALYDAVHGSHWITRTHYIQNVVLPLMQQPGLLQRTPSSPEQPLGGYGQDSHDNYTAIPIGDLIMETSGQFSRDVIKYGTEHHFFFNNDNDVKAADFLGRFPHVFLLTHEVGHSTSSPLVGKSLKTMGFFMPFNKDDASGIHLSWMYHFGCYKLGLNMASFERFSKALPETTRAYFGADCPVIELADRLATDGIHKGCKRNKWIA